MKKRFVCILMSLLMVFSLAACGNTNEESGSHDHDHDHESSQGNENNTSAEIELKLAVSAHDGEAHYEAAEKFAEQVEVKTNGEVKVVIYGSGQLGEEKDLLSAMEQGNPIADIVITNVSDYSEIDPRMDISSLPFLFDSYEDAWYFLDGEIQAEIEQELIQKNIRVLAHYSDGFDCVTTGTKAINIALDIQDLSFATLEKGTGVHPMTALGARTMVVQSSQLLQVLQQNQCDGYADTIESIYNSRIYQVQERLTMTYHRYDALAFAISESAWKTLSANQQEAVKNAAMNSAYTDREMIRQQEKEMVEEMKSAGVRVFYPNLSSFREKAETYWRGCSSKYGSLVDRVIIEQKAE